MHPEIFLADIVNDLKETVKLSKALHKWDCSKCTYNNWPAVKCCTMCGNPRESFSRSTSTEEIRNFCVCL